MSRLLLAVALLLPALAAAEPLQVFASVPPVQTFVEKVGGGQVQARTMVQPGHSPATYDPTPQQIAALARTDLYVRIGVPFEDAWMRRIRAASPDMRILDARAGIDLRAIEAHDHGEEGHHHGDGHDHHAGEAARDPHVWTSPPLVKQIAANIRDALAELDPSHGDLYERNYQAFAAELDSLDREIRKLLADLLTRKFMVFHPAWGYFADTYGLTQIPIEKEGKEPGPRSLAALIEQARREGIRVIFVQPQFDRKSAQRVARAIDGEVIAIDPLAPSYLENMRRVAHRIAGAMQP